MKNPIIKLTESGLTVSELSRRVGTEVGVKFSLKFKRGRRWKLKSFRLSYYDSRNCECCGGYETVSFGNSKGSVELCSHFGPSILVPSMLSKFVLTSTAKVPCLEREVDSL